MKSPTVGAVGLSRERCGSDCWEAIFHIGGQNQSGCALVLVAPNTRMEDKSMEPL